MSNNPYSDHRFTRFLTGKGFYAVLALCLAGAGTAAWLAVGGAANPNVSSAAPETNLTHQLSGARQYGFPSYEEANRSQKNVPVTSSAPSSSQPAQPSSPSQPAKPSGGLPQSDVPASSRSLSFVLPLDGEIFSVYSNGELVKSATLGDWRTHNGIDIKAAEGTPVKAAAAGTVTAVRSDPLWGYVVEIEHAGKLSSIYCGLAKDLPVRQGDTLRAGQTVGTVGYLPAESLLPVHLHFEMKSDGKWVDPLAAMGKK